MEIILYARSNWELAPASGYTSEGIACYVYRTQEPDTVPLYRWYHAGNGDHFYCLDPHGELAPSSGYASEGIACYVPIDPLKNLTEFYRWRNLNTGNHFYSIDPRAEGKVISCQKGLPALFIRIMFPIQFHCTGCLVSLKEIIFITLTA
ncbi:MAG: hypothetical protein IPQ03_12095 [Bacteroidetes bacterium]|nr:hypothetical protein [Bacteroidota bacterium]